jgi:hypothetical protein
MARPLRLEYPGALYHVTSRGNAQADIYMDESDRRIFLRTLGTAVTKHRWLLHAYCLMGNHYTFSSRHRSRICPVACTN